MWFRLINAILGAWLLAAPAVLDYGEPASTNDRIIGPLVAAFAVIAIWETTRELRRMNTVFGIWLLAAPWILTYGSSATVNSMAVGAVVTGLSLVRGNVETKFGGGWTALWRPTGQKERRES